MQDMQRMLAARYRAQGSCENCGMTSPSGTMCKTCTELNTMNTSNPELFHLGFPLTRVASLWRQGKCLQGIMTDGVDFTIPRHDAHKRARKSMVAFITQAGYKAVDGSRMPCDLILRFLTRPDVMLFFIRDERNDALFGSAEMGRLAIARMEQGYKLRGMKPENDHTIAIPLPATSFQFAIFSHVGSCYKKYMPKSVSELPTIAAANANARCAHCTIVASENRLHGCLRCNRAHCEDCIFPACKSCGHSSLGNVKTFMERNMESLKVLSLDAIEQIVAESSRFGTVEDFKNHLHKMTRYIRRRRARQRKKKSARQEEEEECCICLDRTADAVFRPCLHRIMCTSCSVSITVCPICRVSLTK